MSRYYDWDGSPITFDQWPEMFKDNRLAKTTVGGYHVSTVYLGLDHGWGDGPPLIFETMIFGSGALDNDCDRYSTREQALAGHEAAIQRCLTAMAAAFDPIESVPETEYFNVSGSDESRTAD